MPDYKKMYFELVAKLSDAVDILIDAQENGEDAYMQDDPPILALRRGEGQNDPPPLGIKHGDVQDDQQEWHR